MANRKSNAEKELSGNPGRRKLTPETEIEVIRDPSPPRSMRVKQKEYWNRYAPYLTKAGLLNKMNENDLKRLCMFEIALDNVLNFLSVNVQSMLQEKKNYHGDVVDLVESTYSKIARNYAATIRTLKADLGIRTDKMRGTFKPESKEKDEFFD